MLIDRPAECAPSTAGRMSELRRPGHRVKVGCCVKTCGPDWSGTLLSMFVIILVPLMVYQTRPLPGVPSLAALHVAKKELETELETERARERKSVPTTPNVALSTPTLSVPPTVPATPAPAGFCAGHTDSKVCPAEWPVLVPAHTDGTVHVADTCRKTADQVWGYMCPADCDKGQPGWCRAAPI